MEASLERDALDGRRGSLSPSSWPTLKGSLSDLGRSCGSLFRLFHCVGFQHWNLSNVGTCPKAGRRERLTLQRCQQLGCIFMQNYESIKQNGISLRATRLGWQRHHLAIHFVYAGGSESPGPGTVIRYGSNIFYAMFDVGAFFNLTRETEIKKAAERSTAEEDTARLTPFTDEWTLPVSNKRKSSRRSFRKHDTIRGTSFSTDCFTAWIRQGKWTLPTGMHWSRRHRSTACRLTCGSFRGPSTSGRRGFATRLADTLSISFSTLSNWENAGQHAG